RWSENENCEMGSWSERASTREQAMSALHQLVEKGIASRNDIHSSGVECMTLGCRWKAYGLHVGDLESILFQKQRREVSGLTNRIHREPAAAQRLRIDRVFSKQ